MSRETLEGYRVTSTRVAEESSSVDLALDETPTPASSPLAPRRLGGRPSRQAVAAAVAAVVIALVAGSAATLFEQQRADAGAAQDLRLLGVFVTDGSYTDSDRGGGTAGVRGYLHVVNAGTRPVEVVGAVVSGIAIDPLRTPQRVEPGEPALVRAVLEIPCAAPPREQLMVDVSVISADGTRGPVQEVELTPLEVNTYFGLNEAVMSVCSGSEALARVTHMEVDADGRAVIDLRSTSQFATEVRFELSPRMGGQLNGASSVSTVVPREGTVRVFLELSILDCTRARTSLGESWEVVTLSAESETGDVMGYLDGWQPSVPTAAFGFALARHCGA